MEAAIALKVGPQGHQARRGAKIKCLWLDNRITDLLAIIEGLRDRFDIDCAKTAEEARAFIKRTKHNLYLLDFILEGPISRSIAVLDSILAKDKKANIIFISGYLSLEEFDSALKKTRERYPNASISQFDKSDLPVPEDDGFQNFVDELVGWSRPGTSASLVDLPKPRSDEAKKGSLDFPDFVDFESLDSSEQEIFVDKMYSRHRKKIEAHFAQGAIWILFCGSWDDPTAEARTFEEVWSDEKAIQFGEKTGYAPIAFSNIETIDDFVSGSCSTGRGMHGYPIVKIERSVPEVGRSQPFYVHFDTGNPVSLICDNTYTMAGWLPPKRLTFHRAMIGGSELRVRAFELHATQVTDATGAVIPIVFTGYAVENWDKSRFAVTCANDCTNSVKPNSGLCYFRTGLLGRTFQRECKVLLAVDCDQGAIHFFRNNKK